MSGTRIIKSATPRLDSDITKTIGQIGSKQIFLEKVGFSRFDLATR